MRVCRVMPRPTWDQTCRDTQYNRAQVHKGMVLQIFGPMWLQPGHSTVLPSVLSVAHTAMKQSLSEEGLLRPLSPPLTTVPDPQPMAGVMETESWQAPGRTSG